MTLLGSQNVSGRAHRMSTTDRHDDRPHRRIHRAHGRRPDDRLFRPATSAPRPQRPAESYPQSNEQR